MGWGEEHGPRQASEAHHGAPPPAAGRPHQHRNPSPSLEPCAWCNGTDHDRGCGKLVPIREFVGDPPPYFIPYLIDGRFQPAVDEPWRLMTSEEWLACCNWLRAKIALARANES